MSSGLNILWLQSCEVYLTEAAPRRSRVLGSNGSPGNVHDRRGGAARDGEDAGPEEAGEPLSTDARRIPTGRRRP